MKTFWMITWQSLFWCCALSADSPLPEPMSILLDVANHDKSVVSPGVDQLIRKVDEKKKAAFGGSKVNFLRIWGIAKGQTSCYVIFWSESVYKFAFLDEVKGKVSSEDIFISNEEASRLRGNVIDLTANPLPLIFDSGDTVRTNTNASIIDGIVDGKIIWAIRKRDWVGDENYSEFLKITKTCAELHSRSSR